MPIAFCVAWLSFEWLFTFCNLPWILLGYAWTHCEPLVQMADFTGVYGISALILLLNAAFAEFYIAIKSQNKRNSPQTFKFQVRALITIAIAIILITCSFIYGKIRIAKFSHEKPVKSLNILGIQANIVCKDMAVTYSTKVKKYTNLTIKAVNYIKTINSNKIDLIIWSETALPGICFKSRDITRKVGVLPCELKTPIMTGFLRKIIKEKQKYTTYNSAIIVFPDGKTSDIYDKQGLIPLAEKTYFKNYFIKLPFLKNLINRNITPGTNSTVFSIKNSIGKSVKIGPLICYEDTLSKIACGMAKRSTEILVNLTNDGEYPNPKGTWQHQNIAKIRSIETRLPLFRVTNTGITCLIDRCGRITSLLKNKGKSTFVDGFLKVKADIYKTKETFYVRHGNWFLNANLFVCAICVIYGIFKPQMR